MSLLTAILLLMAALAGVFISMVCLRQKKALCIICMTACILIAIVLAVYLGLAWIFLDAIRNQLPEP